MKTQISNKKKTAKNMFTLTTFMGKLVQFVGCDVLHTLNYQSIGSVTTNTNDYRETGK